ncbi:glycosyltransferase [Angustibacter aerolatus]
MHVITALGTGGAERQLELLVARSRQQSAVVALYEGGPVADAIRALGVRVEVLGMAGAARLTAVPRLVRLLRRYRPDVVHVHLLAAQLWAIPAARLAGVPVVVSSEHSLMDDSMEGRPLTPALRGTYRVLERLASHTVAVSATTAQRLQRWGVDPQRVTVVDNGIDVDALRFDPAARAAVRAELGVDDDTLVVGAVGRLEPVKRMDQVLRAAAPLLRDRGAVLVVAGSGSLAAPLAELARSLGVEGRVRWLGSRSDVAGVLSATDVLVSASRDETFGMAVVEGLVAGLPAAYVECPALEELPAPVAAAVQVPELDDDDEQVAALGRVLAQLADEAVARGLQRLPVDPALRSRYGAQPAADRVDAVYRSLTGG